MRSRGATGALARLAGFTVGAVDIDNACPGAVAYCRATALLRNATIGVCVANLGAAVSNAVAGTAGAVTGTRAFADTTDAGAGRARVSATARAPDARSRSDLRATLNAPAPRVSEAGCRRPAARPRAQGAGVALAL